jgi:hypothetical protein
MHTLGWLQKLYQDATMIPDMLILVDDDTSTDIEVAMLAMSWVQEDSPVFVVNPCMGGGISYHKGSGLFFNRAAIDCLGNLVSILTGGKSAELSL